MDMNVVSVRRTSPSLVRVELDAPRFPPSDAPDEACVLHLPLPDGGVDERGRWYTIRAHDPSTQVVTVDIVTHEGGVGAGWARRALPGDAVRCSARNSWFRRPAEAGWQVLLGDVAALPALARIIDETPPDVRTVAVVEVPDPGDEQPLPVAETRWVHNADLARSSTLADLAREIALPDGPGYLYAAGECAATRAVRKHLRHERGLPVDSYGVVGYWRRDAERRRLDRAATEVARLWEQAEAAGGDREEILDIYEDRLTRAGLL